jgi:hypothetical protein
MAFATEVVESVEIALDELDEAAAQLDAIQLRLAAARLHVDGLTAFFDEAELACKS